MDYLRDLVYRLDEVYAHLTEHNDWNAIREKYQIASAYSSYLEFWSFMTEEIASAAIIAVHERDDAE